jgi:hypothetical protein
MGLLDDAIREHLELKRRRGADPGEVAREQRELLDSAAPVERPTREEDLQSPDEAVERADELATTDAAAGYRSEEIDESEQGGDFSSVGQETAELDMQAVLDEDREPPVAFAPVGGPAFAGARRGIAAKAPASDDPLDWEMPARGAATEVGRREHTDAHGDPVASEDRWDGKGSRRILGETSREVNGDIPGQERLTFE